MLHHAARDYGRHGCDTGEVMAGSTPAAWMDFRAYCLDGNLSRRESKDILNLDNFIHISE